MATQTDSDAAPTASPPAPQGRIVLQPGQLSKPEKVWASSKTLIIGFYQAAPYSEAFKIFYKKSGAVFGTQVMLTPASILGPELAVRQPMLGEAQYFEYEIKKLKPSTQYVVKIKTSDDSSDVRSDRMVTTSREEERARDNDMRNFVGALVKLGDYDGLVVSYALTSGIFGIRILQIDDVAASLQLSRLTSDYTDSGVPVQAYTLSQVRFGRWGGAITGSKVVNEGELKWLVARAVQVGDKSDAAAAFEARQRMLQVQVERVTMTLEVEWSNRFRSLRLKSLTSLALLTLIAVAAVAGMGLMLGAAGRRQRELQGRLAEGAVRQAELEAELQMLHLYRVSLELDVERRLALSDPELRALFGSGLLGANSSHLPTANGSSNSSSSNSSGSSSGGSSSSRPGLRSGSTGGGSSGGGSGSGCGRPGASAAAADAVVAAAAAAAAGQRRKGETARRPAEPQRRSGGGSGKDVPRPPSTTRRDVRGGGGAERSGGGGGADGSTRPNDRIHHASRDATGGGGQARRASSARGRGRGGGRSGDDGDATDLYGNGGGGGGSAAASDLWGLPHQALRVALERSRLGRLPVGANAKLYSRSEELRRTAAAEGDATVKSAADSDDPQPDAWMFIHYVSNVYALHLQEWMKVQLQKNVRRKVNEMLVPAPPDIGGGGSGARGGEYGGEEEERVEFDGGGGGSGGQGEGRSANEAYENGVDKFVYGDDENSDEYESYNDLLTIP